jgi:hypothetical protein
LIDLSFEYGCTPRELSQRLLQSDFIELQLYADKYQLPHRRQELLLAQLAQFLAVANGGKAETLAAYMPYREALNEASEVLTEDDIEEMTPEEIREMYQFEVST